MPSSIIALHLSRSCDFRLQFSNIHYLHNFFHLIQPPNSLPTRLVLSSKYSIMPTFFTKFVLKLYRMSSLKGFPQCGGRLDITTQHRGSSLSMTIYGVDDRGSISRRGRDLCLVFPGRVLGRGGDDLPRLQPALTVRRTPTPFSNTTSWRCD